MKPIQFDLSWSGIVRGIFRLLAAILGIVLIILGGLGLTDMFRFNAKSDSLLNLSWIAWGLLFEWIAIHGYLIKRKK